MCLNRGMGVVVGTEEDGFGPARWVSALCSIVVLGPLLGCATTSSVPKMAWVRTDGREIAADLTLLQQWKSDVAACNANLDTGAPSETARGCMAQKGYVLVRRDQTEDVRAAYAVGSSAPCRTDDG